MPDKYEHENFFKCGACGHINQKEKWELTRIDIGHPVSICPDCGCLIVLSIANEMDMEGEEDDN